ncbi:MAG: hypothetical protein KF819_16090 [Labilithrix sp.]|nr:hypothetical protein [Labilithrix sp.]
MFDRPIASFDIETIPDPDLGRRLTAIEGTDAEVIHEMVRLRLEETGGRSEYPQLPWHRVVSVCVTTLEPSTGAVSVRELGGAAMDERSHVEGFFALASRAPRLVSWNGGSFDLPVLRYRAMVLGVVAGDFYRVDGEREANNYVSRRHDLHVDVMDALSSFGASARAGLDTMCGVLSLPGKGFLERPIYDHVLEGDGRVAEYCKLDTVQTLLVFLSWARHCGRISPADFDRSVDGVRAAIATLPYAGWRAIESALAGWPRWA